MNNNPEYKGWAVILEDGRGWDVEIGAICYPRNFLTINMANDYADKIRNKWSGKMLPKLFIVPIKITVDL